MIVVCSHGKIESIKGDYRYYKHSRGTVKSSLYGEFVLPRESKAY